MAFTKEFLQGLGVSDEISAQIFAERGREIEEARRRAEQGGNAQISTLTAENQELHAQLQALSELPAQIKAFQTKITALEQAEQTRTAAQQEEQRNAAMLAEFTAAAGEKKFINDYTKNAVFENVKAELSKEQNKDKKLADVFSELTKDKPDIFANENPAVNIGGAKPLDSEASEAQILEVMGLPAAAAK